MLWATPKKIVVAPLLSFRVRGCWFCRGVLLLCGRCDWSVEMFRFSVIAKCKRELGCNQHSANVIFGHISTNNKRAKYVQFIWSGFSSVIIQGMTVGLKSKHIEFCKSQSILKATNFILYYYYSSAECIQISSRYLWLDLTTTVLLVEKCQCAY